MEIDRDLAIGEAAEQTGGRPTERAHVLRVRDGTTQAASDLLAAEEPLEIRLNGERVAVAMRTPTRGRMQSWRWASCSERRSSAQTMWCGSPNAAHGKGWWYRGRQAACGIGPAPGWQRSFYVTSACGICGKAGIEAVMLAAPPPERAHCQRRESLGPPAFAAVRPKGVRTHRRPHAAASSTLTGGC